MSIVARNTHYQMGELLQLLQVLSDYMGQLSPNVRPGYESAGWLRFLLAVKCYMYMVANLYGVVDLQGQAQSIEFLVRE